MIGPVSYNNRYIVPDSPQHTFSSRLLKWFDQHGRKDLPWQKNTTPYRVWVSEIMLQQTQVITVIPYYQRFMKRFKSLKQLAEADQDEVLHYWAGLGYYARARNLHKTAMLLHADYKGRFPDDIDALIALPGIGRSTAAAILSLSRGQHHAILDGNVKRVLARHHAVSGWTGQPRIMQYLWAISENLTPQKRVADYNQAMMDLGATLCTRTKPACERCPVSSDCLALSDGKVLELPTPKARKTLPVRDTVMLIIKKDNAIMLEKRPPTGIWGGLWSLPECDDIEAVPEQCLQRWGIRIKTLKSLSPWHHTFSHYQLNVYPYEVMPEKSSATVMDHQQTIWYNSSQTNKRGLAAPVIRILKES